MRPETDRATTHQIVGRPTRAPQAASSNRDRRQGQDVAGLTAQLHGRTTEQAEPGG